MSYVELHCHSAFSFLDGASLPDEIVPAALELGYEAVALTDHNSVSGSMEFAVSARALGLRPIHGAEIDLSDGRHLTLLVEDAGGWSSLCRILTLAHAHTREKENPPTRPRHQNPPTRPRHQNPPTRPRHQTPPAPGPPLPRRRSSSWRTSWSTPRGWSV